MELIVSGADFSANSIGVVEPTIVKATFNGTSSYATVDEILLESDGDYIEFDLDIGSTTLNEGYAFSAYQLWNRPSIGICTDKMTIRFKGTSTWPVNGSHGLSSLTNVIVKVALEGTDLNVYFNNSTTPTFTYDNSSTAGTVSIIGFGKYSATATTFWTGTINSVRTNLQNDGVKMSVTELSGWSATDVTLS